MSCALPLVAFLALGTGAVAPVTDFDGHSQSPSSQRPDNTVATHHAALLPCCDGRRPVLTVWTARTCVPCQHFWRDFQEDKAFRVAIQSRFRVQWIDHDAYRRSAVTRGITTVPTFVVGDRRITGYDGSEWLWRRLTGSADEPAATAPLQMSPDAATAVSETERVPSPLPPLVRERSTDTADESPPASVHSDRTPTSPAVDSTPTRDPTDSPHQKSALDSSSRRSSAGILGEWISRSIPFALTGLELVGILGGTAATGGLGTIALAALWRLLKRRRRQIHSAHATTGQIDQQEEAIGAAARTPFPRRLDEARQLLALRQSEGRVATLDALRGMFLDDELNKLAASSNADESAIAHQLKANIDTRVDEVAPLSTTID